MELMAKHRMTQTMTGHVTGDSDGIEELGELPAIDV